MDNDEDEDLWLTSGLNRDALYENDGLENFTEIGVQAGLNATSPMKDIIISSPKIFGLF